VPTPEPRYETRIRAADEAAIAEAAELIRSGELVAVPTETVYGLAADASNPDAVARIFAAKGRPSFNPLIVHVLDADHALSIGAVISPGVREIMGRYWPGPLTLVVPILPSAHIAHAVTAGLGTVALRSSSHPVMRALIAKSRRALAAPSANASGRISPTKAEHVAASLDGKVPLVLDGGPTEHGLESTILKVTDNEVVTLRPGPVSGDEVGVYLKLRHDFRSKGQIEAPGQLASHYAPSKALRLDALQADPDEWMIGFGPVNGDANLSERGDLEEAAARLFDFLHMAERQDRPRIAVAPIPPEGVGLAINDRLRRAAAPRQETGA
jgi:L-threonylcarbamoyladenylate synthase